MCWTVTVQGAGSGDGGSGAMYPVAPAMIRAVREAVEVPIIVGGGINTTEKAQAALKAGADVIVVGNQIEKAPQFLVEMSRTVCAFNTVLDSAVQA